MQRWGKTASGKQRYYCRSCKKSGIRKRADNAERVYRRVFVSWLTGSARLAAVGARLSVTTRTLSNRFQKYWQHIPRPLPVRCNPRVLVVDGVSVAKQLLVLLVAHDPSNRVPIGWWFAPRESYDPWRRLFASLRRQDVMPDFVVCDGQRGLLKALFEIWPETSVQRCVIHVTRQAKAWLTQHPQTQAGKELLNIIRALHSIRTRRQKRRWIRQYRRWRKRHERFLKERSYYGKRWWYTHRKLRAVRSLLSNSLPHLFTYVRHPRVPRTSNHVEGGINSRLKDLVRIHRGLSPDRRQALAAWYLAVRQGQKPTRNFY